MASIRFSKLTTLMNNLMTPMVITTVGTSLILSLSACRFSSANKGKSEDELLSRPTILNEEMSLLESERDSLERSLRNESASARTCSAFGSWTGRAEALLWIVRKNEIKSRKSPGQPLTEVQRVSTELEKHVSSLNGVCDNSEPTQVSDEKEHQVLETLDKAETSLRALRREVESGKLLDFESASAGDVKNKEYPSTWREEITRVKNELQKRIAEYSAFTPGSRKPHAVCLTLAQFHGHHAFWYKEFMKHSLDNVIRDAMVDAEQGLRNWVTQCQSEPESLQIPQVEIIQLDTHLNEVLRELDETKS